MESHLTKSKAWLFIAAALILLVLFVINGTLLIDQSGTKSVASAPPNAPASFLLACAALLAAIAANASSYLNPTSTLPMKVASPITMLLVAAFVIPFFIALGVTMVAK